MNYQSFRRVESISLDDRMRFLANLSGRYYLEKWQHCDARQVSVFACRLQRISPRRMTLAAPVCGEEGDIVTAHFDEFGVLRGRISRTLGFGFVATLQMGKRARIRLAKRVLWCEKRRNNQVPDQRRVKRFVPRNPQSALVLADGSRLKCFVIDMSTTGAAVSAELKPDLGTPLALGTVVGRVVRYLDPGFAIEFTNHVPEDQLEARLIRPQEEQFLL